MPDVITMTQTNELKVMDPEKSEKETPPKDHRDHGWAWVIAIGQYSICIFMIVIPARASN